MNNTQIEESVKLTFAQSRVMDFANKGGIIAATFDRCIIEYQKIPYRFNRRTLNKLIELNLIKPTGSLGATQMYVSAKYQ